MRTVMCDCTVESDWVCDVYEEKIFSSRVNGFVFLVHRGL